MENIPNQETGLAPAIAGRQRVPRTGSRRGRAHGQGEEQHGHRAGSRCVPTHPCTQPFFHVQCSHVPGVPSSRGTRLRGHCCGCRATTAAPRPLGSWKETLQQGAAALFHPVITLLLLEGKDTISIAFKCTYRKEHTAVTKSELEHLDMVSAWDRYSKAAPGFHHL